MDKIANFLEGKKTFIGLICAAVLALLAALGVVDADSRLFEVLVIIVFLFTGVSYRLAIKNPPGE